MKQMIIAILLIAAVLMLFGCAGQAPGSTPQTGTAIQGVPGGITESDIELANDTDTGVIDDLPTDTGQ